jgi:hypothetical protein
MNFAGGENAGAYTYYFKIKWKPSAGTTSDKDSSITVHLPLSTSAFSDNEFFIVSDGGLSAVNEENDLDFSTGSSPMDGLTTNLNPPVLASSTATDPGTIKWSLNSTAANFPTAAEDQGIGLSRNSSESIGWPRVATNASTRYEARIEVVNSA